MRAALRERSIVVNSVLLPVFLYPVVLWLTFSGITFVQGLAEGYVSRVAVFDAPARHVELVDSLRTMDGTEVSDDVASAEEARAAVREERLDAVVVFRAAGEGSAGPSSEGDPLDLRVEVWFDGSESRSVRARDRVEGLVERYRDRWIESRGRDLGLTDAELARFRIDRRSVASGREVGAFLLSEMVPVFLVVMVALGCFVPAIDSTAGERERGTWETSMTTAASRGELVASKYLYVATLGTAAGALNILAMTATVGAVLGPVMGDQVAAVEFEYPAMAIPVMVVGAVILALFFAAAMMILAAFARTFRDGQSMVTPVYWLALLPLLVGRSPDQNLSPELALVPILNVTIMIRDAIQGVFLWPLIGETLLVGVAVVALCLWIARWVLDLEEVVVGSYDGSFWRLVRERVGR